MRLALALGMTLRRLDADMGADELSLWRRFEEEFGLADGFTVAGILAPLLANQWGGKSVDATNFVPYFRAQRSDARKMSGDEMLSILRGFPSSKA